MTPLVITSLIVSLFCWFLGAGFATIAIVAMSILLIPNVFIFLMISLDILQIKIKKTETETE